MKVIRLILLTCLGGLLPTAAIGQTIVWTDANGRRIQSKDVNGGEVQTIVQFDATQSASLIHYDPISAKLYYRSGSFRRSNIDGSDPETIPTPTTGKFTLNLQLRKLYWITGFADDILYRSELDGSGVESHAYPTCCVLTLEAVGDDLFFGAGLGLTKGIWRADADGSNQQFLHSTSQPLDLAYDPIEKKIYCAAFDQGLVRMNSDGTGYEDIVPSYAEHIVVDARSRKVYWGGGTLILRSNLDGSNVEDFVTSDDAGNPDLDVAGLTIVDSYPITGACCEGRGDPFATCTDDTMFSQCECAGCIWRPFRTCAEIECPSNPIPTMSAWGLVVLSLLLMIGAKIAFARRVAVSRVTHAD